MRTLLSLCLMLFLQLTATATQFPWAKRDSLRKVITGAVQLKDKYYVTDFGARGDSTTDCRPAIMKAIKRAAKKGGGRVVIPDSSGVFLCRGPIHLDNNITLYVGVGSTLRFVAEPKLYLPAVETSWEGTYLWNYSPFIYARGKRNITIMGRGIIDGNSAETFSAWRPMQTASQERSRKMNHLQTPLDKRRFGEGDYLRPQLIQFYDCQDITISSVFIRNSPFWCIHLLRSENIILRGIRFEAFLTNNDGIDLESSRNVLVDDVRFNNGDDNIGIKSGRDNDGWLLARPSENILITRCHFKGLHGVVIGSEMSGGVQNVYIYNCGYYGYCKRGIFIKTNPDRGGYVRDIYVQNCRFGEVQDLFYVTSKYAGQGLDNNHFSTIENLHVDSLTARRVLGTSLILQGTEAKPIRSVTFTNVEVPHTAKGVVFENTEPVMLQNVFLGPRVTVPSQASAKDKLFEHNDK